jgi:signal transduction histidine kinase
MSSASGSRTPLSRLTVLIGWGCAAALVLGTVLAPPARTGLLYGSLAVTVAALVASLSRLFVGSRVRTVFLSVTGLGGAALDLLQPSGPGMLAAFVSVAGLGLSLRPRVAAVTGGLVLVAAATAEGFVSSQPVSAILNVSLGALFLLFTSAFAALSRQAQERAEDLAAQVQASREAREQAAVVAERARMARELHDILAHTLSGLSLQLSGTRLLAQRSGADPRVVEQLEAAHRLAKDGMANAKSAVAALRGETLPGADALPQLLAEARLATGIAITSTVTGTPRRLSPEAGLTVYRTAQEALTNAAKHGGQGTKVNLRLVYDADEVCLSVENSAGSDPRPGTAPGFGLTGLAERAALHGGHLEYGPEPGGWCVALTLPATGAEQAGRNAMVTGAEQAGTEEEW